MNNSSSVLLGVIVVILIALAGWFAYTQGFFDGKDEQKNTSSIQLQLGGSVSGNKAN